MPNPPIDLRQPIQREKHKSAKEKPLVWHSENVTRFLIKNHFSGKSLFNDKLRRDVRNFTNVIIYRKENHVKQLNYRETNSPAYSLEHN
jgi:hypothetical protein